MARSLFRRAAVVATLAGTLVAGATAPATAQSTEEPTEAALVAGGFSVACQYAPPELRQSCGDLEPLTADDPAALILNPFTTNIVILGAGLFPDGGIRPVLEQRLQAGLRLANKFPTAPIIVTGGVPQNGRTEAQAMNDWLIGAGVDPRRITQEGASDSTVQNARYSGQILTERRATGAVIVTNDFHLKRAMGNFRTVLGDTMPVTGVIAY